MKRTAKHLLDATPPSDVDIERQLLGSLMVVHPNDSPLAELNLRSGDFYDTRDQLMFSELAAIHRAGQPFDIALFANKLKSKQVGGKNGLDAVGGQYYLEETFNSVVNATHATFYAKKVKELATKRRLLYFHEKGILAAHNGELAADYIVRAYDDLEQIERGATVTGRRGLISKASDEYEHLQTDWAWRAWLPKHSMTVLDGEPGLGKTTISFQLAARMSTGSPMPPLVGDTDVRDRRGVLIFSAEDDPSRTIRPRLQAAGADLSRIRIVEGAGTDERDEFVNLKLHLPEIEAALEEYDIGLIIFDPIGAYSGDINLNSDPEVRQLLQPIKLLLERHDTALLFIRHLNKDERKSAINRGTGSTAIIAAMRCAWIVGRDPNNTSQFVLACSKNNLSRHPRSMTYQLADADGVPVVNWVGETEMTANEITGDQQRGKTKVDECTEWLKLMLAAGRVKSDVLEAQSRKAGFSKATYKRARGLAEVKSEKDSFDGGWMSYIDEQ